MFGVDLNDPRRSYCPVGRAGTKWWRYLFNYLVQISIINSFILMKSAHPCDSRTSPSQKHLVFRRELVRGLLSGPRSQPHRAPHAPRLAGSSRPYSANHTLVKMPGRKLFNAQRMETRWRVGEQERLSPAALFATSICVVEHVTQSSMRN
ncbi:PiggyBac transposable element-derived protein 4-like [Plakobranchus ocellatus]|uniref:PiggyBac transposable element-derived protein 4-like n=1 Tax=Plakobranchus ocellatus TaxID=259542 RepID=A0AAV4D6D7_9GAST|nr:PiggyBac transposable element-derived protein 4-like [Plakobranchus ocellatus]